MPVTLASRLDPWLPPLLLMGVIFLLSAQPDLSTGLGLIDLVGRKVVHAGESGPDCLHRLDPHVARTTGVASELSLEHLDDLQHAHLLRVAREGVAALDPALAL